MMSTLEILATILLGLILAILGVAWVWRESSKPGALERQERTIVSMQERMDRQQACMDRQQAQIDELLVSRSADHELLKEWIAYARRLAEMFRAATGQEPPAEPSSVPRKRIRVDPAAIARLMEDLFSLSDLSGLAFELGISESVSGETIKERAISLVETARRRGLLPRLVELGRRDRPEGFTL